MVPSQHRRTKQKHSNVEHHICFIQAALLQYLPKPTAQYITAVLPVCGSPVLRFCDSAVLRFCNYVVMQLCIVNLNRDSASLGMVLLLFGSAVLWFCCCWIYHAAVLRCHIFTLLPYWLLSTKSASYISRTTNKYFGQNEASYMKGDDGRIKALGTVPKWTSPWQVALGSKVRWDWHYGEDQDRPKKYEQEVGNREKEDSSDRYRFC